MTSQQHVPKKKFFFSGTAAPKNHIKGRLSEYGFSNGNLPAKRDKRTQENWDKKSGPK